MNPTVRKMVEQWEDARMRTFLARQGVDGVEEAADYWADLELSTAITRDVVAGRWCAVADLLRLGEVETWARVGTALGMTETEAADGFRGWIAGQVDLHKRMGGRIGVTPAEADQLHALADLVAH